MADILQEIRSAFNAGTIPVKNIALRKANDEIKRLRAALQTIEKAVRPLEGGWAALLEGFADDDMIHEIAALASPNCTPENDDG